MKKRSLGAALAVLLALVTGCTPDGGHPQPPTATATQRTIPAGHPDRDQAAVRRQLAAIDPCTLLNPKITAAAGKRPELFQSTPFDCRVADNGVRAVSYADSTASQRHWQERIELNGAVAYRSNRAANWCTVTLPVDFEHAITFSQDLDSGYDCAAPERYAKDATTRLRDDPASFARKNPRPGVAVCDVLSEALGELAAGQFVAPRASSLGGLSGCGLSREAASPDGAPVYARKALTLEYRRPLAEMRTGGGWEDNEVRKIAGTDVLFWKDSGAGCTLLWDAWPNQTPERERVVQAQAEAPSCEEAVALTGRIIPALLKATPQTLAKSPLIYGASEPDLAGIGACAHVLEQDLRKCAPATNAAAATDPRQVVQQGVADPNTLCAAAAPAVRRIAGAALEPVTAIPPATGPLNATGIIPVVCEFVEPSHSLVVRVGATASLSLNSTQFSVLTRAARETTYAGHDARTASGEALRGSPDTIKYALVSDTTGDQPGVLLLEMFGYPDRGDGTGTISPATRERLNGFDDLATALSKELLGTR